MANGITVVSAHLARMCCSFTSVKEQTCSASFVMRTPFPVLLLRAMMSHILLKPLKMVALHSVVCVVGRGCILVPDAVAGMQGATWHGTRAPFSAGSRAINRWEVSDPLLCGLDGKPVVHRMISRTGGQNKDFYGEKKSWHRPGRVLWLMLH